ncbi:hypothetical protein [Methanoregula sp.]|uniref:hypothetical protein n=1 Tax=Methanoregula sp. TaxID=2052170 RepID=UPI002371B8A3|nr:hypothetical protein [Methanoregula sp.]MDD1687363.1 hypothetical protein [Methanoregula sp.]
MTLVILAALFLTLFMAGLLIIFIFHIDGFTIPAQYYEAYRDESPRDHPDVVSARDLTEEDMTAHPALSALIIHRKRVVVSLDPRQVLSLAREWNRYSWMPVSPDDEAFLSAFQDRIVWYHGKTYYIEGPVGIPSGEKCGRGTQC